MEQRNNPCPGAGYTVLQEALLTPGAPLHELHLAAAVSGGADSMALLRILLALQPEFGFELSACHVNHGLRGESAHRDEAFVRAECARLGVPLRVFHAAKSLALCRNMPGRTGPAACVTPALSVCAGRG